MKIILVMVQTIDGRIAKDVIHNSIDWNSKEDKQNFRELTMNSDYVVMGSTTYEAMGQRALPGRNLIIMTSDPTKYQQKDGVQFLSGTTEEVVEKLKSQKVEKLIIAGGAKVNAAFLKAGLIDEIYLTFEPIIFGKGMSFVEDDDLNLKCDLVEVVNLNENTILLHYKVRK